MSIQRKMYETRADKVKDFFIGFLVFWGVNILFVLGLVGITAAMGTLGSNDPTGIVSSIGGISWLITSVLPTLINLGLMIYFGITRIWIFWGMLGGFASGLLLATCLVVACFGVLLGLPAFYGG
jgi:hypothetical protein